MTRYRLRRRYRGRWGGRSDRRGVVAAALAGLVLAAVAHASSPGTGAGRPSAPAVRAASPASGNVALGRQLAAARGWGYGPLWRCLNHLWTRESGWSQYADTRATGLDSQSSPIYAYGIPQARPVTKMPKAAWPASLGGRSDPRTQIRWGLGYIATAYATPCGAWAHEQADGWY